MSMPSALQQTEGRRPSGFASRTGVSLKSRYYQEILAQRPAVGFFEIHAENYLSAGGPARHYLDRIRQDYDITVHGVGLSLGGTEPLDDAHLERVAELVARIEPAVFSEHLAWSTHQRTFLNDLLPLPYTEARLTHLCEHVDHVQSRLQRTILIENPSTYVEFCSSQMSEAEFITELVKRTGCGLLLDINNVEVSSFNHGWQPDEYLEAYPLAAVQQIHLAGYCLDDSALPPLKIDSHDAPVADEVWQLYEQVLATLGDCPTLIERDGKLPPLAHLLQEAHCADQLRAKALEAHRAS